MKRLIIGTAGHVDHGKTALVKALTGIECDTHREEKSRGITINLGFAHLDLSETVSVGIVDVPGHRDFVHTMVGGAAGIDIAVLVVAADSGVMPQTVEHLKIMDILGIRSGLVALTKTDLVDPEISELASEEIRELLEGSFLESSPIIPVSSVTKDGLEQLRQELIDLSERLESRASGEVFRLFPDRIFSVAGFGTVVTGSVLGGTIKVEDTAYLLPSEKKLRVRRIERHGTPVESVSAGDRASLNLVGLDRSELDRGMVISDRVLSPTKLLDAQLRLFEDSRTFGLWTKVVFHLGTYEQQARIHLIDAKQLPAGESGLVQIHVEVPCIVQPGDRYVIRSSSSDVTLGGGEIIDPAPLHHRRRTAKAIEHMGALAEGKTPALISAQVRKAMKPIASSQVATELNMDDSDVRQFAFSGLDENIVFFEKDDNLFLATSEEVKRIEATVLEKIDDYHRKEPLSPKGKTTVELIGAIGVRKGSAGSTVLHQILNGLENRGTIARHEGTWIRANHKVQIDATLRSKISFVVSYLEKCAMSVPDKASFVLEAKSHSIQKEELDQILHHLVDVGSAYHLGGDYVSALTVDKSRSLLLKALPSHPEGMSVSEFRDLIQGNRKICLLLYSRFDNEGITVRSGDTRKLTRKGEEAASALNGQHKDHQ